ncbi:MAG: hydantoinase/oxoprolinase family protein [Clostridiales bacterium]|nr:hydantoinase/oxoprolinase family protein [Clostridiales bacterium]
MVRVGIDTGGTFTDFVFFSPTRMWIYKVLSTPRNPGEAIRRGLEEAGVLAEKLDVIHGSTVATNALLERKGANLGFLTTAGFEDLLEIGRQTRRELYNILVEKRNPLIPRHLCFGLKERTLSDGRILQPVEGSEVDGVIRKLKKAGVESIAICLLHSYANPANEEKVLRKLKPHGFSLSVSHRVLREYREFERASTTAINAYVAPLMERYLSRLEKELGEDSVHIMQSNGGCVSARGARDNPVCTILSGPAGGVVGAKEVAAAAGFSRIISFDMGGTSTDVSLCDREMATTTDSVISDLPLRLPIIDIHTVGSGGGSVAFIDRGGALRVGPQSAGADPGPICYGRGEDVTVTDANLILGRLDPDRFLGGAMKLYPERARLFMKRFARRLGLSVSELAEGIIRVADTTMERAIRVISVERGFDPRDFALLSFGGAGGMHACSLAQRLRIPTVVVPKNAGVLSALGMLLSDTIKDYSQSILKRAADVSLAELNGSFRPLLEQARQDLKKEGFEESRIRLLRFLDVRYIGQSYELTVPFLPSYRREFDRLHHRKYSYADEKRPVEVVNLRVKAIGLTKKPGLPEVESDGPDAGAARLCRRLMRFEGRDYQADVYARELLKAGNFLRGPALVLDYESTAVVGPGFVCRVDKHGNLIMTRQKQRR